MIKKQHKNIINNIQKLANSGVTGFSLNQLRVIIALERLVARMESSPILSQHLIFKGGFALLKYLGRARFTHDLDASYFSFPLKEIESLITKAMVSDIEDGMWYGDIRQEPILNDLEYSGIRFNCAFQIGSPPDNQDKIKKLSRVHFDIGLADVGQDNLSLSKERMPSLLDDINPVSWYVYPLEQIFAEKLETFVKRGSASSRGKDIYDLVQIYPLCQDLIKLNQQIRSIFKLRNIKLPKSLILFAKDTNTTILKSSWSSIIFPEDKTSFDEVWSKFVEILGKLDQK